MVPAFRTTFSSVVAPLNQLITQKKGKHQIILWSSEAEYAFMKLKQAFLSASILQSPNFEFPFMIQCDASGTGCVDNKVCLK